MTKESQYQGQIFKEYLLNQEYLDSEEGQQAINEHMLTGWLANKEEIQKHSIYPRAKNEFKRQWHLNQTYLDLLSELSSEFQDANISPVLLKGITFLEHIYPDLGDRSMSDIDMLINPSELNKCISLLEDSGFSVRSTHKWRANSHKVELTRVDNNIEVVIELHTRLLYHTADPKWSFKDFSVGPYQKLMIEDEILYLCTHVGFQHSFLKLFWLIDLHHLLDGLTLIDEKKVINSAKKYKVYNSFTMALYLLSRYFGTDLSPEFNKIQNEISRPKKSLLSIHYLMNPKENILQYLVVKHLCKDNLKEAISYNLGWIKDRFSF